MLTGILAASLFGLPSGPIGQVPIALENTLRARVERTGRVGDEKYAYALVDLNGAGRKDAVVILSGRAWCGSGGCTLYVLTQRNGRWHFVSKSTVTRAPVRVLQTRQHGWRALSVHISGGGTETVDALLPFDGRAYPLNPTVPPAIPLKQPRGALLIGSDAAEFSLFR